MLKVVLDANQYVSAVLKPASNPAKIFKLVTDGKIALCVSHSILAEIRRVLLYPKLTKLHQYSEETIDQFIAEIANSAIFTREKIKLQIVQDDPTDDKYLECAVEAKADFIVSGDRHLKDINLFQNIRIVSPTIFLEITQKEHHL